MMRKKWLLILVPLVVLLILGARRIVPGTDAILLEPSGSLTLKIGLPVSSGGTGVKTLTDGGILLGSGTAAVTSLAQATNGQIPVGSTGADPVLAVITEGLAIDITNGAGSITSAFDPTELLGSRTWGDGSTDTIVWTWDRATGTDPTATFNSGSIDFQAVTEGGNAVYNSSETPGGELGGTWASPTIDDGVSVTNWTLVTPALGTPSSGVATNLTGTAAGLTAGLVTNGVYTTDNMSVLAATTSAQFSGVISNETGTGLVVLDTNPTFNDMFVADGTGVVIGHTAQIVTTTTSELQILGTGGADSDVVIARFSNSASNPVLDFLKSRDTTIGSNTIVQDNDTIGMVRFLVDDGTDFNNQAARFAAKVDDASPATGDVGAEFVWSQMPGGGGGISETMTLSPAGNLTAVGTVRSNTGFDVSGAAGVSGTLELDDGTTEKITLVFTGGILTSRTVAATTSSVLANWTD